MTRILNILAQFLKEVEKDNPHNLVLKGGTALSLYYLDHHRESEDLDFDVEQQYIQKYTKIEQYIQNIFEKLKEQKILTEYRITKAGFASTKRYHISIQLKTHKIYHTKIDIDFVELPKIFEQRGELLLYSQERLFIGKLIAFTNRNEFKDLYDISQLIKNVHIEQWKGNEHVQQLLQKTIETIKEEDINRMFKTAFRNIDMRFKNLKESQLQTFIQKTEHDIHKIMNIIKKEI
ncbi:nucleotidyl transferase AbiEii/AbiGii toxin family protein [Candidatus Woesearchaeota archaeon]|nr:nucleotidyl transferase AbiEii/AbiGii toxin family protein [Candidatus Woesearchaeota archaeon]